MYPCEWKGDDSRGLSAGIAFFTVEGKNFEFRMESFSDFQRVSHMLEMAFDQGREFGANAIRYVVTTAATRRALELSMKEH